MKKTTLFIFSIILLSCFIILDFPGSKIILYFFITLIILNKIYTDYVKKNYLVKRYMDTNKVFAGVTEITNLIVSNNMKFPIHSFVLIDYSDLNISLEQTHPFIFSLEKNGRELISYEIMGRKRGKYKIGPTVIRFSDLIGLFSFDNELYTTRDIIVFPNILKVSEIPYQSMQPYGNIKNKMPIFDDPSMIIGIRDYQLGDEIRRINWKATARHSKFLVNVLQPSISSSSIIILNLLENDYEFKNKDYHIERGIEIAASFVQELFLLRQEISFAANCQIDKVDNIFKTNLAKGEAHFTSILTSLSIMEPSRKIQLSDILQPNVLNLSWGISIYLITPRLDEITLYRLIDYKQAGHSVTIINFGPEIRKELSLWSIGFQSYYSEIQGNVIGLMRI